MPPEPSRVVFADFTQRGGHRAMQRLLADRGALPEAVFAASDALAFGAMAAIREAGLRVPEDIAVVGFDGLEEGNRSDPPLSTVCQPAIELGREAVRMLLTLIADPAQTPIQRYLPTHLIVRRSCGCQLTTVDDGEGGVEAASVLSLAS